MMQFRPTAIERAFQLARAGDHPSVSDILKQLKAEGLSVAQIEGESLRRQLRELCKASAKDRQAS